MAHVAHVEEVEHAMCQDDCLAARSCFGSTGGEVIDALNLVARADGSAGSASIERTRGRDLQLP
jgi:hypothetical protein